MDEWVGRCQKGTSIQCTSVDGWVDELVWVWVAR